MQLEGWPGLAVWVRPGEPHGNERTGTYVEPNLRARLRAGDPDAFGVLFDQYAHAVYNLGFRLTGNWPAAEEVVSVTFLEAWRLRDRIGPGSGSLPGPILSLRRQASRNVTETTSSAAGQFPVSRKPRL